MKDKTINYFSDISLNNSQIFDSKINEDNYSNKNICTIKTTTPPTATEDLLNATFLYIGETTNNYKNNTLYICKKEGEEYKWSEIGKLGGDGVKTATELPTASADNLGSVYLVNKVFYQCVEKDGSYEFAKLGYIDEWVEELADGTLKPSIAKNGLGELKNVELTEIVEKNDILNYNGLNWVNSSNMFAKGTTTKTGVGGIAKNADIGEMTPLEILNLMLVGELDAEALTLNEITTTYAKGTTIETLAVTATCRSEGDNLAYISWYKGTEEVHRDTLTGTFAEVEYAYENIDDDIELKAILTLASGITSEASRKISFVYPSYYGKYGDADFSQLLQQQKACIINYNYEGMVQPVYKYPSSYGELTLITDESGVDDYTNSFTRTMETINDISYYVYTKSVPSVHTNFKYWFR